jgi:hypothetical protein
MHIVLGEDVDYMIYIPNLLELMQLIKDGN